MTQVINTLPLRFNPQMIDALEDGRKKATRRILTAGNTIVEPGRFENVRLETGRAKHSGGENFLRARCRFESGERTVSIRSKIQPCDLFWVRRGQRGGTREASTLTLDVWSVEVSRLQDMTEQDAIDEGIMPWHGEYAVNAEGDLHHATARLTFWALWDSINGRGKYGWDANPWVWTYKFTLQRLNIDQLLKQRTGDVVPKRRR